MTHTRITCSEDDSAKVEELQKLGLSIDPQMGYPSGPIGAKRFALAIMRSDKAGELADLLPWLLTRGLGNHIFEQKNVVAQAIMTPALHAALIPVLEPILHNFVYNHDCAHAFLTPAHCIAKSQNADMMAMALRLFPEALKRASWDSTNWGNLACDYLDVGGDPDGLIGSLKILINSQTADPSDSFLPRTQEEKLSQHLCSQGFIRLLNHKRVAESSSLKTLLQPYAGEILEDTSTDDPLWRENTYILTSVYPNRVAGITYSTSQRKGIYTDLKCLEKPNYVFTFCAAPIDIATIAIHLFEQTNKTAGAAKIREAARQAAVSLRQFFAADLPQNPETDPNPTGLSLDPHL